MYIMIRMDSTIAYELWSPCRVKQVNVVSYTNTTDNASFPEICTSNRAGPFVWQSLREFPPKLYLLALWFEQLLKLLQSFEVAIIKNSVQRTTYFHFWHCIANAWCTIVTLYNLFTIVTGFLPLRASLWKESDCLLLKFIISCCESYGLY